MPNQDTTTRRKVQVWILHGENVLLLKTQPTRGAFWQPVTGWVEKDESLEAAAIREAEEETGLPLSQQAALFVRPLGVDFRFTGKHGPAHEHVFFVDIAGLSPEQPPQVRVDSKEHSESCWVHRSKAEAMLGHPSNQETFRKLIQKLGAV